VKVASHYLKKWKIQECAAVKSLQEKLLEKWFLIVGGLGML